MATSATAQTSLNPLEASLSSTLEPQSSSDPTSSLDSATGELVHAARIKYAAGRHSKSASSEIPEPVTTGPRAWHCELCPYVQTRQFVAELRRHIHTHFAPKTVCRGERTDRLAPAELAAAVAQHGPPLEHEGVLWVGGCWKAMARPDALLRHLANPNTPCIEPSGLRKRKSKSKVGCEVEGGSVVAGSSKSTGTGRGNNVRNACK
ncbi:hypothetical protein PsYK624_091180 [Phanerochaete sordida]|uniref:C2H2-type domain-containing protein n=1 Tax=Phanerochaete sordida TaxID=48140 RepID=A0A9P3GFX0_9APHY|nr:hypothetical protein PsYK624_091180 [Phanerochaete sordida]